MESKHQDVIQLIKYNYLEYIKILESYSNDERIKLIEIIEIKDIITQIYNIIVDIKGGYMRGYKINKKNYLKLQKKLHNN